MSVPLPPAGTLERWAYDLVTAVDLHEKLHPSPPPPEWEADPPVRRLCAPGRPAALRILTKVPRSSGADTLRGELARARLLHTFCHHELQAAELMCWALLAFPDTPRAFRQGLVQIALDELRHFHLYREVMEARGLAFGDEPVRDWFWQRVPQAETPAHFVATLGVGLEGGNLDHAARYARRFRDVGDEEAAALQEKVCAEEVAHVRFAAHWFSEFTGGMDFDEWARHLSSPLSPTMMHGDPINREDRLRAGLSEEFLQRLASS